MSVYHQRFADLATLPALMAAPQGLQAHFVKHALAATLRALSEFGHAPIIASTPSPVHCPLGQVSPRGNPVFRPPNLYPASTGRRIKAAATASSFCSASILPLR